MYIYGNRFEANANMIEYLDQLNGISFCESRWIITWSRKTIEIYRGVKSAKHPQAIIDAMCNVISLIGVFHKTSSEQL